MCIEGEAVGTGPLGGDDRIFGQDLDGEPALAASNPHGRESWPSFGKSFEENKVQLGLSWSRLEPIGANPVPLH